MNRKLFVSGILEQNGTFRINKVNNQVFTGRVFLNPDSVIPDNPNSSSGNDVKFPKFIELTGWVSWPINRKFSNYLKNEGMLGVIRDEWIHNVQIHSDKPVYTSLYRQLKRWLLSHEEAYPLSVDFARALMLAEKEALPTYVSGVLRKLGISHLFVISGFHVGIIFFLVFESLVILSSKYRYLLSGLFVILYLSFLGWPLSATRAGIMILVFIFANVIDRDILPIMSLILASLVLIAFNPYVVFSSGFQLSIGAVSGIVMVLPWLERADGNKIFDLFWVNVVAFLTVSPIVMFHFNYFSPLGIPASFLASLFFPFLLIILSLQLIFIATSWSAPAIMIENFWRSLVRGMDFLNQNYELVFGVPELRWYTILLVLGLIVVIGMEKLNNLARISLASILVIFFVIVTNSSKPQQVGADKFGETPVLFSRSASGEVLIYVPSKYRLNRYNVTLLNRYLNGRGHYHVDYFISNQNRWSLYSLSPKFSIENVITHWSVRTTLDKQSFSYNPVSKIVYFVSSGRKLKFTEKRSHLSKLGDEFVGCFEGIGCLIRNRNNLSTKQREWLGGQSETIFFLQDSPLVIRDHFRNVVRDTDNYNSSYIMNWI